LLLIEDEPTLARAMRLSLEREGYRVLWAADGSAGLELFNHEAIDLVLLDLMLPGIDGLEICRTVRRRSRVPILITTARGAEDDRVLGLDLGADDYLVKPFGLRELVARARALLRRAALDTASEATNADPEVEIGPLRILPRERRAFVAGAPVELRRREFDLLLFLARHPNQVLTRDLLLERVWGRDFEGEPRTVDVHIRMLREKVEADPANPALLHTVRNVGYTLRV
jgi:two-component system alkaline phosphatase synthesis response regulator PhoP